MAVHSYLTLLPTQHHAAAPNIKFDLQVIVTDLMMLPTVHLSKKAMVTPD